MCNSQATSGQPELVQSWKYVADIRLLDIGEDVRTSVPASNTLLGAARTLELECIRDCRVAPAIQVLRFDIDGLSQLSLLIVLEFVVL